jgi:arabinose-5-phosphate isomerase
MDYLEKARRVIEIEIAELQRLALRLNESFEQAIRLIYEALEKGRKIILVGVGKSGQIGEKIAATLTSTGTPAFVLSPVNALHGDIGIVADGDAVIALSYSGETAELLNILPALRRFDTRLICMTGNLGSTLAKHSEVVLDCSVEKEACPLNLAPTSSTTVMLALGDALAMVLLETRAGVRYHARRNADAQGLSRDGHSCSTAFDERTSRRCCGRCRAFRKTSRNIHPRRFCPGV